MSDGTAEAFKKAQKKIEEAYDAALAESRSKVERAKSEALGKFKQ